MSGAEEGAMMMYQYRWADKTWRKRLGQVRKWLRFCKEEGKEFLSPTEGDVLTYIGFFYLIGRVSARSAPQYVLAVLQYHINNKFPTPTPTYSV